MGYLHLSICSRHYVVILGGLDTCVVILRALITKQSPQNTTNTLIPELFLFGRSRPYARSHRGPLFSRRQHFRCVRDDSRILAVKVEPPGLSALFVSAPAPHSGMDAEALCRWSDRLLKLCPGQVCFFCIDANARVGSIPSEAIEPHAAEEESQAGSLCWDFADSTGIWARKPLNLKPIGTRAGHFWSACWVVGGAAEARSLPPQRS